jgi:hypothetical protein
LTGDYAKRPLPIRLYNALAPAHALQVKKLMAKAQQRTGLFDYGDAWFIEPLSVLVQSINEEARLSALGTSIMQKRVVDALATRLRAEDLFSRHPEILDIDLGHVFVIAGLQRTGTTLLHRMIASDPKVRAPMSWEVLNPAPLPGDVNNRARIRQAKLAQHGLKFIAPTFFAIHPVEWDMPEEDVLFLDVSFMSQSAEATMRVPTYAAWLENQDSTPAYAYLKKLMQLLHYQNGASCTVLKSPHHMEYIDTILKVFPAASIIQTHRDPQKTMASFVSMVCHGVGVFSNEVNALEISTHWQRKVHRLIELSEQVRATHPDRFMDVAYSDLITDPLAELQRVYDHAGVACDDETRTHARALLKRQVQNKYGRHHYDAADFGMTTEQIARDFDDYRSRFNITPEAPS